MSSGNTRIIDLLQLQNLTKRDPAAYKEEFKLQYQHYLTQLQIFQLKPTKDHKHFSQLVSYLAHVSACYPKDMSEYPKQICDLLENSCTNLEPELRRVLVKSLILMRNKNMMQQIPLLSLFFKLFRVHDKPLRKLLYSYIVSDIKNTNVKQKNVKLNKSLQNFMFTMMSDSSEIATIMSLKVMIDLFQKKIWHDIKTVNVIASGVFSKNTKIVTTSLNFFLKIDGADRTDEEDKDNAEREEEAKNHMKTMSLVNKVAKKTRAGKRRLELAKDKYKKIKDRNENRNNPNFPAIELIHDPQGYCERLFSVLKRSTDKFDNRLMMMSFISRLISTHKLLVYNFYPYMQKYLTPNQKNITYILAAVAQSCHELVDPDILKPVIRNIATYFANDGSNPEVIAIGLNTIRAICQRCPLAMDPTLLRDLIMYKDKKEKGVKMAGRSLLQFFREYAPKMLAKKDRGREGYKQKSTPILQFGQQVVSQGVQGIELLYDEELNKALEKYEAGEWSDDESDDDSDGAWEEVDDEQDEQEDSDQEDQEIDEEDQDGWESVDSDDDQEIEIDDDDQDGWESVDDDEEEEEEVDKDGDTIPKLSKNKKKMVKQDEEDDEDSDGWESVDEDLLAEIDGGEWEECSDDDDDNEEEEEVEEVDGKAFTGVANIKDIIKQQQKQQQQKRKSSSKQEEEEEEEDEEEEILDELELKQLKKKQKREEEKEKQQKEEEKKKDIDLDRILTDEDLKKIQKLRMIKDVIEGNRKISEMDDVDQEEGSDDEGDNPLGLIDASNLMGDHKKTRSTKEDRLQGILAGREGRDFGSKKARKEKSGHSMRNELKAKLNKPYVLAKQSDKIRKKQFLSMRDKQMKRNKPKDY